MLQDPDGVSDLEYYLVENPHRLNSGYEIKRFLKFVNNTNRSYKKIFGKQWKEISYKYAMSLVKFEFDGYWHGDLWLLNSFWKYVHLFRRGMSKILPKNIAKPSYYNYFPWLKSYHTCISEDEFLAATRTYIDDLCSVANKSNSEYFVLDQLISPDNVERYIRYANDLKTIIVDRDPRDVYVDQILSKNHVLPKDPIQFSQAYRDVRKNVSNKSTEDYMYINFEDLIYRYDESIKKVIDFVGIDESHHIKKGEVFKPEVSINNTKMWERYPEYKEACAIITEQLPDMLHRYE
jgi:hypothetical protein